jgi:hypothetical protein
MQLNRYDKYIPGINEPYTTQTSPAVKLAFQNPSLCPSPWQLSVHTASELKW